MPRPIELLCIDPTSVQVGEMEKEDEVKIFVPVAKGRDGRNYFRMGSGEEILAYHPSFVSWTKDSRVYLSEFRRRLEYSFLLYLDTEDFTAGVDARIADGTVGALEYNHRELAVWAAFEKTRFKITY